MKRQLHKGANEGLALAVPTSDDPHSVKGPLEVVDPTREDPELVLQNVVVMRPPDADGAGDVGGGDPLAVGGVTRHRDRVGMLTVYGDLERVLEVADDYGSTGAVQNVVGFGVAGDEDAATALGGGCARVGLQE